MKVKMISAAINLDSGDATELEEAINKWKEGNPNLEIINLSISLTPPPQFQDKGIMRIAGNAREANALIFYKEK